MSGGGGGGYGGGPSSGTTDCNIVEVVPLNSVQPLLLPQLQVRQELTVSLTNNGKSLVAEISPGKPAGALTPTALADLLDCMTNRGRSYKAIIRKIRGALVEVEIRPK